VEVSELVAVGQTPGAGAGAAVAPAPGAVQSFEADVPTAEALEATDSGPRLRSPGSPGYPADWVQYHRIAGHPEGIQLLKWCSSYPTVETPRLSGQTRQHLADHRGRRGAGTGMAR